MLRPFLFLPRKLAADITTALNVGQRIVEKLSARNRRRLWLPKITRDWFRENTAVTKYDVDDFNIEQFGEIVSRYMLKVVATN